MDQSTLSQVLAYYPWACVVLGAYTAIVWVLSFIGLLMLLHRVFFKHERFNFYYAIQFFVAGSATCRYYELFDNLDSTLPLVIVDPIQATFTMILYLFLPVAILTASGIILSKVMPQENLLFTPAFRKKLKELWRARAKTQNPSTMKISKRTGQHLAVIIGSEYPTPQLVKRSLEKQQFMVIEAENGASGLSMAAFNYPDLVILDSGLSDMESSLVLRRLREWTQAPVIILNADQDENEMMERVNTDHDYYLPKPFSAEEFTEYISEALRHIHHNHQRRDESVFQTRLFKLDRGNRTLIIRKKEVHLTPHEFHLLSYLVNHAGRVVTLKAIHQEFWGRHMDEDSLRQYIHQLRYKIELDPVTPKYILTEPGFGYRLKYR